MNKQEKRSIDIIDMIVIHHSATPRDLALDKSIKSFDSNHKIRLHSESNSLWYHIAYHYVIDNKWTIKQTRSLNEVGYHAWNLAVNNKSIWICLIWNFDIEIPTEMQYRSLTNLILHLQSDIPSIYRILGHKDIVNYKTCPGKNFDFNYLYKKLDKREMKKIEIKDLTAVLDSITCTVSVCSSIYNHTGDGKELLAEIATYLRTKIKELKKISSKIETAEDVEDENDDNTNE